MFDKGIGIIDPKKLELIYQIKTDDCIYFLELNDNVLAMQSHNNIIIIKLGEKNYEILETINATKFGVLGKLWNNILIGCSVGELFFFKEKNNSFSKVGGIYNEGICKFVTQTKENELVYVDFNDYFNEDFIIFFDLKEWKEKKCIKGIEVPYKDFFNIGIISDNLLFIGNSVKNKCNLINVDNYEIVQTFEMKEKYDSFYAIKGKYLFISADKSLKQYNIEKDKIILKNECETVVGFQPFICLNNGKNGKFICMAIYGESALYY